MQVRTTQAGGHGINRIMALALGSALVAALILGAVVLTQSNSLPLIGSTEKVAAPATGNGLAEIVFSEQNSWEYAPAGNLATTSSLRFAEANSFDYAGATEPPSIEAARFLEENSFDYVVPMSQAEIAFIEANSWDYRPQAQFAEETDEAGSSTRDFRFMEENLWDETHVPPSGEVGQRNYSTTT